MEKKKCGDQSFSPRKEPDSSPSRSINNKQTSSLTLSLSLLLGPVFAMFCFSFIFYIAFTRSKYAHILQKCFLPPESDTRGKWIQPTYLATPSPSLSHAIWLRPLALKKRQKRQKMCVGVRAIERSRKRRQCVGRGCMNTHTTHKPKHSRHKLLTELQHHNIRSSNFYCHYLKKQLFFFFANFPQLFGGSFGGEPKLFFMYYKRGLVD